MGKSPGKWMKTLIFGKKSLRSKNPKANNEKKGDEKDIRVSIHQIEESNLSLIVSQRSETKIEENLQHDIYQDAHTTTIPPNQLTTQLNAQTDFDIDRQEQAATNLQAALRGYLARREFRILKGIIRLQALIRGHLVRRQAISTLYCMFQIVKFQAVARGRKIRHSLIGVEVQKKCTLVNPRVMSSVGVNSSTKILNRSTTGFARKILASSPTATPLHFQYDSNETNSVLRWLERWSTSRCWQPLPKPQPGQRSKLHKPHTRRSSITNVETIASEFDKPIRHFRNISSNEPANLIDESPELVLERVKRNLRKVNNPSLESTVHTETGKLSVSEAETLIIKEKPRRRVSDPVKQKSMENHEPPLIKRSVPSYMAATVSANAKIRSQDGLETPTALTRRYSLSSLTNSKISLSPKIQSTGKLKNDRSLQLSRDGNVKVNQAEWRR